ncbi:VOC family protein [Rufibacter sp. DG15C]|uniref:VOC family protein n=1 Tax=Rufibacter sp. DG15C TaxID=1379909 RepID=UPI0018D47EBE|nr:VOC family protein [Rufibacter sp. DG15C]
MARHTSRLPEMREFYTQVLELEVLGSFIGHNGYDGIFLGKKESDWHLEFTQSSEEAVHIFDEDDVLVFYPVSHAEHERILDKIHQMGLTLMAPKNPYWLINGRMILDPDGFRIIISPLRIKHA